MKTPTRKTTSDSFENNIEGASTPVLGGLRVNLERLGLFNMLNNLSQTQPQQIQLNALHELQIPGTQDYEAQFQGQIQNYFSRTSKIDTPPAYSTHFYKELVK